MTINISANVNTVLKVPFTSINLQTGLTSFTYTFLKDGITIAISPSPIFTEIGGGLYVITFTPSTTGVYSLFIQGEIAASINVVVKDVYTSLANIEDQALGSWSWDKVKGTMTMYKQNGTVLATFLVKDSLTIASRSRQ